MNVLASREDAHSFLGSELTRRVKNFFCTREKFSRGVPGASPWFSDLEVQFLRRSSYGVNLSCEFVSSFGQDERNVITRFVQMIIIRKDWPRGLQNNFKTLGWYFYVNYGADCLKAAYMCMFSQYFFLQKSAQYTAFTMEIRKQRENSKTYLQSTKNLHQILSGVSDSLCDALSCPHWDVQTSSQ